MIIYLIRYPFFFMLGAIIFLSPAPQISAGVQADANDYQLSLTFDLKNNTLTGTARITLQPGPGLSLSVAGITVTGTLLKEQNGSESKIFAVNDRVVIPASSASRELYISYTKTVSGSHENTITPEGISLVSNWHPVPDAPVKFTLEARLPPTFTAVSETDHFPLRRKNSTITAAFSQPLYSLHLAAGPYSHKKLQVRQGLFVHSLFFAEDKNLADGYLQAAAAFIKRYEKEVGPYPYNHYVIAANRLPTGFGIPGFTLIGQTVLRLPFIKETSLGHEILHSWFGNKVGVDYTEGNWCEGLTSYLADHSYRADKGEGIQDRKDAFTRYYSYNNPEAVIPLGEFKSASHHQHMARARRAVGYIRGAMLFHELKEKIGANSFYEAIRLFYDKNKGKDASWKDLQESFEANSETELSTFFQERLNNKEIPLLEIQKIAVNSGERGPVLSFTLVQKTQNPFSLVVPLQVRTVTGTKTHKQFIHTAETRISIELNNSPLEIIIDPEYSFLRTLSQPELPAVWSRFMGDKKKLVILTSEKERETFKSLLQSLPGENLSVKISNQVSNQELGESSLLFLGTVQSPPSLSLFGNPGHNKEGFTLDVRTNPLNPEHVAVLVSSANKKEADATANRLSHYGKYSFLHFLHGRNLEKKISSTQSGLRVMLDLLPQGGKTSDISSFDQIMEELSQSRVIYIGEMHTSFSDHRLQHRIIESLYAKEPNLVIGMEMFPKSKQPALDRYLSATTEVDEQTFLKESGYFNVWGYDYRFFRDIINFAKTNSLSVLGLNLEKAIVSSVFESGNTDSLENSVLLSLPAERNLDMKGYRERLTAMHTIHMQGNHGRGSAGGFIQAQGLWDESMAENIANYLKEHPGEKMIVLAGSQHTRKDSGIPPRVKRRIDVKQSSVLNISSSDNPANLAEVADFFFLSRPAELPAKPKIGIVLIPSEGEQKFLKISQISPHGKAGESGLRTGDILKEINGFSIEEMSDLKIAMIDAQEGESVMITVLRDEDGSETEKTFSVELSSTPPPMMHP